MSTRRFLLVAAAFWLLFGLVAGIQVWISMLTHGHDPVLVLGYHVMVWWVWLAPTALIISLARRMPVAPPRLLPILGHGLAATAIGLLHSLYSLGLMLWLRPYDRMTAPLSDIQLSNVLAPILLEWVLYLLVLGAVLAVDYGRRSREHAVEAAELRRSLTDARLHALELQIQPHFLFNTLNAISGLVRVSRKDEAIRMIAGLADLLRYSLDHAGRQRVALGEEVEMLTRYLEIQQTRFPDRMSFSVTVDAALRQAAVPILILQPLAENAVRHGVDRSGSMNHVEVRARQVDDRLELEVRNRGTIASPVVEGIGLRNTRERLRALYGNDARFELTQSGEHVLALLDLPLDQRA
ncbi:sensor histidine kinase [Cognatilysobacter bugurensis]|nr:histidine kinase [Lysobacter bugurensis]